MQERKASPREYDEALHGLEYPAPRDAIIRKAQDHGGLDGEVLYVLEQLPDRTYESRADIDAEVERIYAAGGGLEGGIPAAGSEERT